MTLDEAFDKKDEVSVAVQKQLQECMQAYGFEIHRALVTELAPNQQVMASMNEINKQKRLRDAAEMAAESDKIRVVKAAEAAADAAFLQGQGIARQRGAIIDGLRDSICGGSAQGMSSDRVSELLLITQYFETMRDIAANPNASVVFVPAGTTRSGASAAVSGPPPSTKGDGPSLSQRSPASLPPAPAGVPTVPHQPSPASGTKSLGPLRSPQPPALAVPGSPVPTGGTELRAAAAAADVNDSPAAPSMLG
eukprot:gnl/TRDRNA2_/TRDRNA2_133849_c1_seq1.p1 gnl/TRDRNA2_/TRDRNA2_133849_c1~~gnl/TRDRNA2_/TRDRNA2_133849_c1_seq1.p1  ORF type:complete len:263 (-),score=54.78 gnl/TRDRNA2_/TRDRNA2_133849_c1_seq1:130-882(-)